MQWCMDVFEQERTTCVTTILLIFKANVLFLGNCVGVVKHHEILSVWEICQKFIS